MKLIWRETGRRNVKGETRVNHEGEPMENWSAAKRK